tara:strand:- start:216 stop:590 length:375 start_codon:yes stop_codon:yes gene_type:complete
MNNNQIFLQTKFINLELSNTSLNDLLDIIKKYKIKYELVEYVEYEYIENIQKEIYCIHLTIYDISIKDKLEELLDLLIETYNSKSCKYLMYIYNDNNMSSIKINKKGKKITTKNQRKFTTISIA